MKVDLERLIKLSILIVKGKFMYKNFPIKAAIEVSDYYNSLTPVQRYRLNRGKPAGKPK